LRVKIIIALAIASIYLLALTLPAGAVEGVIGIGGTTINIPYPTFVAPVIQSTVVPCVSFQAPTAAETTPIIANTIDLGGPALQSSFTVFGSQVPSFSSPNFILQQLTPPSITGFSATNPVFSVSTPTPTATPIPTAPTAGFTVTPAIGPAPLTVQVTDTSTGATSWQYSFGDSTPNSTAENPSHTYIANGTYVITQTVSNSVGSSSASHVVIVGGNSSGPAPLNLTTICTNNLTILAETEITNVPASSIIGNMGLSPAAASYITGFALVLDGSGQFSTSSQVSGKVYAADYSNPTPNLLTTAVNEMQAAYNDAAGRPDPNAVNLGAGELGGFTLAPGLYKWTSGLGITTGNLILDAGGNPNAVWIFQIGSGLTVGSNINIILAGGAQPQNIFWQVGTGATIGTGAHFNGIILSGTAINLQNGATVNGNLLAQSAVTLNKNTITGVAC